MPGARRTHCHACKRKKRTQANTGTPKSLRHSLRNGFTAYSVLSLVSGLFSHHRLIDLRVSAARPKSRVDKLDPSVGGSGPHGLTVRIVPHVLRPDASIATRLTSGDEGLTSPVSRRAGFF